LPETPRNQHILLNRQSLTSGRLPLESHEAVRFALPEILIFWAES
jgi:hypothetical protein